MKQITKYRLYLSKEFIDILNAINDDVSIYLIKLMNDNFESEISYIDISDECGKVTFLQSSKINIEEDNWNSKNRTQPTKIGKVINKILNGKVSNDTIEHFSNKFKALTDKDIFKNIKIVKGKDINKWYLESNYSERKSTLGTSCMRYKSKNSYMDFYNLNSENKTRKDIHLSNVSMVILLNGNNKLLARAILWENSIKPEPGRTFMDRIYSVNDHYIDVLKFYASKNGWLYKKNQSSSDSTFFDPYDNNFHTLTITFRMKNTDNINYEKYPYLDTLKYFTPKTGRISSKKSKNKKYNTYRLEHQNGGYIE